MTQVVQAHCPKCRSMLRIPVDWIGRPLRCKLCREIFQARSKAELELVQVVGPSAPTPLPPTAVSSARLPRPVQGNSFSFNDDVDFSPSPPLRSVRKRGGGWMLGVLLLGCVAAVAGAVFLIAGPHLADLFKSGQNRDKVAVVPSDKARGDIRIIDNGDKKNTDKKFWPTDKKTTDKKAADKKPADKKTTDKKFTDKIASVDKIYDPPPPKDKKPKVPRGAFPRRALLINVNNYIYANGVSYGSKRDDRYGLGRPAQPPAHEHAGHADLRALRRRQDVQPHPQAGHRKCHHRFPGQRPAPGPDHALLCGPCRR